MLNQDFLHDYKTSDIYMLNEKHDKLIKRLEKMFWKYNGVDMYDGLCQELKEIIFEFDPVGRKRP